MAAGAISLTTAGCGFPEKTWIGDRPGYRGALVAIILVGRLYRPADQESFMKDNPSALRLMPGLGLGGGEHRQVARLPQALRCGEHRAGHADQETGDPPLRSKRELTGDLGSIKATQRCGDIGQQYCRDRIAADEADEAGDKRQ